jgi:hypothetical protein
MLGLVFGRGPTCSATCCMPDKSQVVRCELLVYAPRQIDSPALSIAGAKMPGGPPWSGTSQSSSAQRPSLSSRTRSRHSGGTCQADAINKIAVSDVNQSSETLPQTEIHINLPGDGRTATPQAGGMT